MLTLIGAMIVYVELTADIPGIQGLTKGSIHDMPEGVARAYIAAQQAKESDAGAHSRASLRAEIDGFKAEVMETVRSAFKPGNNGQDRQPPGSGGGVDFNHLGAGDRLDPAKLAPKERWFHAGQMVRALVCAQASDSPPEEREWGRNLLHNLYCAKERIQYKVVEGEGEKGLQRYNDNIGVTRTGTESISGGSTYGFLVKPEWSDNLYRLPIEESVIEPYAFQIPVGQALEFKMPALDQYNTPAAGQSAAYAGFSVTRKGEITQRGYSDGKVDEIDYKITDLTAFTTYSRDLDADAYIRIGALIQQTLGQAFMWKKDYEFIQGNGVGMPLGILNNGALYSGLQGSILTYDRNTANTIYYEDVVGMMQQIHPALWKDMYWITNSAQTLTQLVAMKTEASGNAFVFLPNSLVGQWMTPKLMGEGEPFNNLLYRAEGMLQGKPVLFSEKLPQLGSTGDLILCNPRYAYGVATRAGLEMGMSEHFLFDTDRVAVRWKLRNDGKPLMRGPFIQSDGGLTSGNSKTSWCSVLAAHH